MGDDSRIASILGAWQERLDRGEDVDPEAVIAEHPDLADELREQSQALSQLRHAHDAKTSPTRLRTLPVDRYGEFKPAGEGGMGIVYWAIDTDLNREVAFKIIRSGEHDAGTPTPKRPTELTPPGKDTPASKSFETLKKRFLQEAWITSGMAHPGIVPVYELGQTPEGVPYYTMRFIKGERTLATALEESREADVESRLALLEPFLKVCDTLRYAHSRGVIHRDLKPENIAIGEFGEVVLLDWGLAKLQDSPDLEQDRLQAHVQAYRDATDLKTVAGALGTPGYMAPEAARGHAEKMDARSDVYSLGAILYQILTGRLPFDVPTFGELIQKILHEDPQRAADVDIGVPEALSDLCALCLAREAEDRPESAHQVAAWIRDWQTRSAMDREVEGLTRDASAALSAAKESKGDARIRALDRVVACCSRILTLRPDHAGANRLQHAVDRLRAHGLQERERAVRAAERSKRRRLLVGGSLVGLVMALVGAGIALQRISREQAATEQALHRARSLALLGASRDALAGDATLSLLLATEAARLARTPATESQLHAALVAPVQVHEFSNLGGALQRVDVDPREELLLTTTHEGVAILWRIDGEQVARLGRDVTAYASARSTVGSRMITPLVGFSPAGDHLLTSHHDSTVRIWNRRGECAATLEGDGGNVMRMQCSPDGATVLTLERTTTNAAGGVLRLWDVNSGRRRFQHGGHAQDGIRAADFSPDGDALVALCVSGAVRVLDLTGRSMLEVPARKVSVLAALLSPDGRRLLTREADDRCRVWTIGEDLDPVVLQGSDFAMWSPVSTHVVTESLQAKKAWVWDLQGEEIQSREVGPGSQVGDLSFAEPLDWMPQFPREKIKDAKFGLVVSADGRWAMPDSYPPKVYDVDGNLVRVIPTPDDIDRFSSTFSASGRYFLATVYYQGPLRVWDLHRGELGIAPPPEPWGAEVLGVPLANGQVLCAWYGDAFLWDLVTNRRARVGEPDPEDEADVSVAVASPSGDAFLLDWCLREETRLHAADGRVLATLPTCASCAAFSPDGKLIATATDEGSVRLWDRQGKLRGRFEDPDGAIHRIRFTPDGQAILTLSDVIRLWDPSGRLIQTYDCDVPGTDLYHICTSADGRAVLALSGSGIHVWDETGDFTLPSYDESDSLLFADLAQSPQGDRFALACSDGRVRMLDAAGKLVRTFRAHHGYLNAVRFSPEGDLLLTASEDGTARIWDREGTHLATLAGHRFAVGDATWSPDGKRILTVTGAGWLHVWSTDFDELLELARERVWRGFTPEERKLYEGLLPNEGER